MKFSHLPVLAVLCITAPAAAQAITITNASQLMAALSTAKGGEVFDLAPGDYGQLTLKNFQFANAVTIRSANASKPATFGKTTINGSSGIKFDKVEFANPLSSTGNSWDPAVYVYGSKGISFNSVSVHGSLDNNPLNDGYGIFSRNSNNVSVTNSQFTQLTRAVVVNTNDNILLAGNNVYGVRSEGFNLASVQGAKIIGNKFSDFHPQTGDHPDAIQIFSAGATRPSTNIQISNNLIVGAPGQQMQGIFVTTQKSGPYPYQNVTISNNVLVGTMWHGITLMDATGASVTGNTLFTIGGQTVTSTRIQMTNVIGVLSGNIAKSYVIQSSPGLKQLNNTTNIIDMALADAAIQQWMLANKDALANGTWTNPIIIPTTPTNGFNAQPIDEILGTGQFAQVTTIVPVDYAPGTPLNSDGTTSPTGPTGPDGQSGQSTILSAVPEPATWAQLLLGFGLVGWLMRRGRAQTRIAVG